MNTTIRLRINKDIDAVTEKKILKLKGNLIAQSITDIIHIEDDGEHHYINFFTVETSRKDEVIASIRKSIAAISLNETIAILEPSKK